MPFELMGGRMTQVGGGAAIDNDKFSRALEKIKEASLSKYGYRMSDEEARKVASGQTSKVNIRKKTMDRVDRDVRNELAVSGLTGMYRGAPTLTAKEMTAQWTGYWEGESTLQREFQAHRVQSERAASALERTRLMGVDANTGLPTFEKWALDQEIKISNRKMKVEEANAALERAIKRGQETGIFTDPVTEEDQKTLYKALQDWNIEKEQNKEKSDTLLSLGLVRYPGTISAQETFGVDVSAYWDGNRVTDPQGLRSAQTAIAEGADTVFGEGRLTKRQISQLVFGTLLVDPLLKASSEHQLEKDRNLRAEIEIGEINNVQTLSGRAMNLEEDLSEWQKARIRAQESGNWIDPETNQSVDTIDSKLYQLQLFELTGYLDDGSPTAAMAIAQMDRDLQLKKILGYDKQVMNEETGEWEWVHVYGTNEIQLKLQAMDIEFQRDMQTGFYFTGEDGTEEWFAGTDERQKELTEHEWTLDEKTRKGYWKIDELGRPEYVMGTQGHDAWKENLRDQYLRDGLAQEDAHFLAVQAWEKKTFEGYEVVATDENGQVVLDPRTGRPQTRWVYGAGGLEIRMMEFRKQLVQMEINADTATQASEQAFKRQLEEGWEITDPVTGDVAHVYGRQEWERLSLDAAHSRNEETRLGYWTTGENGEAIRVNGTESHEIRIQKMRDKLVRDGWEEEAIQARADFERRMSAEWGHWVVDPRDPKGILWVEGTKTREWNQDMKFLNRQAEIASGALRQKWNYNVLEFHMQKNLDLTMQQREHIHRTHEAFLDRETQKTIAELWQAHQISEDELRHKQNLEIRKKEANDRKYTMVAAFLSNLGEAYLTKKIYDNLYGDVNNKTWNPPLPGELLDRDWWAKFRNEDGSPVFTDDDINKLVENANQASDGAGLTKDERVIADRATFDSDPPGGDVGGGDNVGYGGWRPGAKPGARDALGAAVAAYMAYHQGGEAQRVASGTSGTGQFLTDMLGMGGLMIAGQPWAAFAYGLGRWAAHQYGDEELRSHLSSTGQTLLSSSVVNHWAPPELWKGDKWKPSDKTISKSHARRSPSNLRAYLKWPTVDDRGYHDEDGYIVYEWGGQEVLKESIQAFQERNQVEIMPLAADMVMALEEESPGLLDRDGDGTRDFDPWYMWIFSPEREAGGGVAFFGKDSVNTNEVIHINQEELENDPYFKRYIDIAARGIDLDTDSANGVTGNSTQRQQALEISGIEPQAFNSLAEGLAPAKQSLLYNRLISGDAFTDYDIEMIFGYRIGMTNTEGASISNYYVFDSLVKSNKLTRVSGKPIP